MIASRLIVVIIASFLLISCCQYRLWRYGAVYDRLETNVILGFGEPPCCIYPGVGNPTLGLHQNQEYALWLREVFFDSPNKPVPGRDIQLDIVDSFGNPSGLATIRPLTTKTSAQGLNVDPIIFKATQMGTYRIRAKYRDKNTEAVSYSPIIVVNP